MSYYADIKDHVITPITETEKVQAYYLHKPGQDGSMDTRIMSTLIVFTPENIVITGDLSPGQNGVVSCIGYDRSWFTRKLSPDYLASKFLQDHHYDEDRARRDWQEWRKMWLEEEPEYYGPVIKEIEKSLEDWHFEDPRYLYDFFSNYINDYWEIAFGVGYKESDYNWLAAIQRRFSEAWQEHEPQGGKRP